MRPPAPSQLASAVPAPLCSISPVPQAADVEHSWTNTCGDEKTHQYSKVNAFEAHLFAQLLELRFGILVSLEEILDLGAEIIVGHRLQELVLVVVSAIKYLARQSTWMSRVEQKR